jgi:hypothetical protein
MNEIQKILLSMSPQVDLSTCSGRNPSSPFYRYRGPYTLRYLLSAYCTRQNCNKESRHITLSCVIT